ncbi:hypothetical protein FisN_23Lh082 [Fistulifera solaris]|uniref:Uncharacterized protein n=1 Tax=Fistulifera solaris TaxID=1519565 RepID=A0A1Z5KLZ4_FISSO|nr:hypothetical protein FisN_23Lh082 [Fistulifera solaris]|eukprot:GAX27343.1 hypothetical protein FisN_23Lh082 [Fistulifera solaris]
MAVENCDTEKPVTETVVEAVAEECAGTPNGAVDAPSDENVGMKKRPSPAATGEDKYESPMKKVSVAIVAEESREAAGDDALESTTSPVEEAAEEEPTGEVIVEGEKPSEEAEASEEADKASKAEVPVVTSVGDDVVKAVEVSPQLQDVEAE